MPANKMNFLVVHRGQSQVYGASSKEIALTTPLPPGAALEDRRVLFIAYQPDDDMLVVHPVPLEEVRTAEVKVKQRIDSRDPEPEPESI